MYLISLYFDENNTKILNNYIKMIREKTKNDYIINRQIPAHLTVATLHDMDENNVINQLNSIMDNISSGYIDVVAIGTFSKNTIYLIPILNKYLSDLSFQINNVIEKLDYNREYNRYKPYCWLPHISIARRLNGNELSVAFDYLNQIFKPMHIKITGIALSKSSPYQDICLWNLEGENR